MRISAWLCCLVGGAVLAACGGARKVADVEHVDPMQDVGSGMAELRQDLESTVLENYSHLSLGNLDAYADSIAEGLICLLGPRATDLVLDGSPLRGRRDRRLLRDRDIRMYSKNLELHLSKDGSAAWVADEISYRVPHQGREAALSLRYTAVFARKAGRWEMLAEHLSYPLAVDRVVTAARAERLPKPSKMGRVIAKAAEVPASIVRRMHAGPADYRASVLSTAASALQWLPDTGAEYRGPAIGTAPRLGGLFGGKASFQRVGIIAQVTASETVAWVAEQSRLRVNVAGEEIVFPIQGLYVMVKSDGGWKVVQSHVSVPLTDGLIDEAVFGDAPVTGVAAAVRSADRAARTR